MTAATTSSLGSATRPRPPAGGPQAGAPLDDRTSRLATEVAGITYRQLDHWARCGVLGPRHQGLGSGRFRSFTDEDLEALHAAGRLAELGCNTDILAVATNAVRSARVRHGEVLVITADREVTRQGSGNSVPSYRPAWVVRLCPFSEGRPA